MATIEESSERERLNGIRIALEKSAGIGDAMQKAREGRFWPLGASGEKCTPSEYEADEYDHLREKTRDLYFSVVDSEVRKSLIQAEIDESAYRKKVLSSQVAKARNEYSLAKQQSHKEPWFLVGGVSAVSVWAITQSAGVAVGISGAVAAVFIGMWYVSEWKRNSALTLEQCKDLLDFCVSEEKEYLEYPDTFSSDEASSGERKPELDDRSAYGELLARTARG